MEFNLKTVATLKHINVRKEGPKDAEALAFDLKFACIVSADVIDDLLCVDNEGQALAALWLDNEEGKPRFPLLSTLSFNRPVTDVQLETLGMHLPGCKVGKFTFEPLKEKRANLLLTLAVSQPPGNALPILADFLTQDIEIDLQTQQRDLLSDETALAYVTGNGRANPLEHIASNGIAHLANFGFRMELLDTEHQYAPIGGQGEDDDTLLPSARAFVINTRRASISAIQRHLKIGYNRAARMIEQLELDGTVTPMSSNGTREVITLPLAVGG